MVMIRWGGESNVTGRSQFVMETGCAKDSVVEEPPAASPLEQPAETKATAMRTAAVRDGEN